MGYEEKGKRRRGRGGSRVIALLGMGAGAQPATVARITRERSNTREKHWGKTTKYTADKGRNWKVIEGDSKTLPPI